MNISCLISFQGTRRVLMQYRTMLVKNLNSYIMHHNWVPDPLRGLECLDRIDKSMNLAWVIQLPRGVRCTCRPETSSWKTGDFSDNPSLKQTKHTRLKVLATSEQVPFNRSEWEMNARHPEWVWLEHPELRSRIKNVLMDRLQSNLELYSMPYKENTGMEVETL